MTTRLSMRRRACALAAAFVLSAGSGMAGAQPPRILDAADHAELTTEMSEDGVVRVALLNDRIERVIREPGGFAVEHDPTAGDLYLRPVAESAARQEPAASPGVAAAQQPQVLFVGSEKGSTYRLALTPVAGGPSQILVRDADVETADPATPAPETDRVAAIAGLIRAMAGNAPPAGYSVEPAVHDPTDDAEIVPIEVWRGSRFEALVLALDNGDPADAPNLAAALGADVVAVWIPERGVRRHSAERLAVAVREARAR